MKWNKMEIPLDISLEVTKFNLTTRKATGIEVRSTLYVRFNINIQYKYIFLKRHDDDDAYKIGNVKEINWTMPDVFEFSK